MAISKEEIKRVKGQGFLLNRGTERFSARVITENGVLSAAQLQNLSEAAQQFGNGNVTFTTRLTVEIPGIAHDQIQAFQDYIAREGMETGGTGAKVRPVVSCKGTTCVFGLHDTQALAKQIHERMYKGYREVSFPHKFKIAVGGCPNNCVKPDLNDLGIVGQRVPKPNLEKCRGCARCVVEAGCPMKAAKVENGKLTIDESKCSNCGRCTEKCPFGTMEGSETLYKVYVGGRWGKQTRMGSPLSKLFTRSEVLDVVEKVALFYISQGIPGERFGSTVDRIGLSKVEEAVLSDELLARKEEILKAPVGGVSR